MNSLKKSNFKIVSQKNEIEKRYMNKCNYGKQFVSLYLKEKNSLSEFWRNK